MKARGYQDECTARIRESFKTKKSLLVVMPTGCGKTFVFNEIAREKIKDGRVMIIAHRKELLHQAADKLKAVSGISASIEQAENWANEGMYKSHVVVASKDTLVSGYGGKGRMSRFDPNEFSLLIIDEAHHATASTYRKVVDHFTTNPNLRVLGVTATPDRADDEALGQVFDDVAFEYGLVDAIDDGWLVPINQQFVQVHGLDYSGCKVVAGELNGADLARVMEYEKNLQGMASSITQIVGDKKTLVFAASVKQAERMTEILNRHRQGSARIVTGKSEEDRRAEVFREFESGKCQFLVNVGVTTEGYDCPGIEVVAMCRATLSRSLYAQMVGRGTRALPGVVDTPKDDVGRRNAIKNSAKPEVLILDFLGNAGRHNLISTADILGGKKSDKVVERAKKNVERTSEQPVNMMAELDRAERELLAEQEARVRRRVLARAKYATQQFDPFKQLGIMRREAPMWHRGVDATNKQLSYLERNNLKIPPTMRLNRDEAGQLIEKVKRNKMDAQASPKQKSLLGRYGYDTSVMTAAKAGSLISRIKANGWRKLRGD